MKTQFKTVNEIAKLTGITIRTLHYYDEKTVLKKHKNILTLKKNRIRI